MASPERPRNQRAKADRPNRRWRFLLVAPIVAAVGFVAVGGWFDRSDEGALELGRPDQILLVNDAGPVRLESHDPSLGGASVVHRDSWLLRRPLVEEDRSAGGLVVRITCPSSLPCRSSADLTVPHGTEVVVVSSEGVVEVGVFDGSVSIFSTGEGVALGAVDGSVRVVSDGPVDGFNLRAVETDVLTSDGDVHLVFTRSPRSLSIDAASGFVDVRVPNQRFVLDLESQKGEVEIDVRQSETSSRLIVVRAEGDVVVSNQLR